MTVFGRLLPAGAVKGFDRQLYRLIETVRVHAPRIRMRARLVEALDPTMAAEEVFGGAGTEAVAGQRVATGNQLEPLMPYDHVNKARHSAHRAIAIERRHRRFGHFRLEPHRPAMAAA